uniref:Macaca fascicularis brain cDNA, clone: QflA-19152 n=1 Tax=Macaca fascicularis TaxID=9541 RepID=I7GCE9_MACFA|nr:unnamed protein product [Macaca fascicularis]
MQPPGLSGRRDLISGSSQWTTSVLGQGHKRKALRLWGFRAVRHWWAQDRCQALGSQAPLTSVPTSEERGREASQVVKH